MAGSRAMSGTRENRWKQKRGSFRVMSSEGMGFMKVSRREVLAAGVSLAAASAIGSKARADTATAAKPATTQNMPRTRVGVIGCGGIAGFHAHFNTAGVELVAMCD